MTAEEKAKAYDEAIERAEALIAGETNTSDALFYLNDIKYIFPELAESEDESIKKEIYNALRYLETELSWDALGRVDILDAYAWLEKQCQVKESAVSQHENKYKEALERMKSWVRGEHPECFTEAQKTAEFIFPELKESEDERISREITEFILTHG